MSKHKNKSYRDPLQKNTNQTMKSLRTPQEQQLQDINYSTAKKNRKSKGTQITYNDLDQDQEEMLNVSFGELKDTSSDKISAVINQLIAKNKINAKNAFDVPMIHLQQTKEYNSLTGDNNWKKISSTLDSNNKIYGYRVDATHNYTYKVLELLTRQEKQSKNVKEQQAYREEPQTNFLQFDNQEHTGDEVLFKYLQKNYKGINILHLEVFFNVNPILQKTKRIFDQQGLRGLLLNNIEIQSNLLLKLSYESFDKQKKQIQEQLVNEKMQQVQDYYCEQKLRSDNIFTKIYNICCLNDLLQQETQEGQMVKREDNQIDIMWRQLENLVKSNQQDELNHNLVDLNSVFINGQQEELNNRQNNELEQKNESTQNKNPKEQKNGSIIQQIPVLAVETSENNPTPLDQIQINILNAKQPETIEEPSAQVETQGKVSVTQNDSVNKKKSESGSEESKQPISTHFGQGRTNMDQISHIQSQNIPLKTDIQLSKVLNLTDPLVSLKKEVPISSVIRLSKKIQNPELILKEIQTGEQFDKNENQGNVVETWKRGDKKAKVPRKPKKAVEKPLDEIDFLGNQNYSGKKHKQKIIKVEKVRKLQFKKFMKDLNPLNIYDQHIYTDTSRYKVDFKITTYYREDQPFNADKLDNDEQAQQLVFQTNMLCNQSNYIDLVDQNNANQTKTVSLKYVKQKIHSFIFEQKIKSFAEIYYTFIGSEGYITPALCFLTILHLTNQHGLRLQSQNDDIRIFLGQEPTQ